MQTASLKKIKLAVGTTEFGAIGSEAKGEADVQRVPREQPKARLPREEKRARCPSCPEQASSPRNPGQAAQRPGARAPGVPREHRLPSPRCASLPPARAPPLLRSAASLPLRSPPASACRSACWWPGFPSSGGSEGQASPSDTFPDATPESTGLFFFFFF